MARAVARVAAAWEVAAWVAAARGTCCSDLFETTERVKAADCLPERSVSCLSGGFLDFLMPSPLAMRIARARSCGMQTSWSTARMKLAFLLLEAPSSVARPMASSSIHLVRASRFHRASTAPV